MTERQMIHLQLEIDLLKKIDDFRFKNRLDSRTEAIRILLNQALDRKHK